MVGRERGRTGHQRRCEAITVITPAAAFFVGASRPKAACSCSRDCAARRSRFGRSPALDAITDGGAELRNVMSDDTETIDADAVIVVGERRPRDWSSLVPASATVHVIGDALVPRRVGPAISEGRAAAEAIRRALSRDEVTAPA